MPHVPQEALQALEEAQESADTTAAIHNCVAQQSEVLQQLQSRLEDARQQQASPLESAGHAVSEGIRKCCADPPDSTYVLLPTQRVALVKHACNMTQADDSQEAADRFLELSAALEEAESQLADTESQLQELRDIEQQLQQQVAILPRHRHVSAAHATHICVMFCLGCSVLPVTAACKIAS